MGFLLFLEFFCWEFFPWYLCRKDLSSFPWFFSLSIVSFFSPVFVLLLIYFSSFLIKKKKNAKPKYMKFKSIIIILNEFLDRKKI